MSNKKNRELSKIKTNIIKLQLVGAPGLLLLGLGLYGLFGANGNAFHPLLNDQTIVYSLLIIGGLIEILQLVFLVPLLMKQAKIHREL